MRERSRHKAAVEVFRPTLEQKASKQGSAYSEKTLPNSVKHPSSTVTLFKYLSCPVCFINC